MPRPLATGHGPPGPGGVRARVHARRRLLSPRDCVIPSAGLSYRYCRVGPAWDTLSCAVQRTAVRRLNRPQEPDDRLGGSVIVTEGAQWVEFDALVEVLPWGRSDYTIIRLERALATAAKVAGTRRVEGTIDDVPVNVGVNRADVLPSAFMYAGKGLQRRLGARPGDVVTCRLRPADPDDVPLADDVHHALATPVAWTRSNARSPPTVGVCCNPSRRRHDQRPASSASRPCWVPYPLPDQTEAASRPSNGGHRSWPQPAGFFVGVKSVTQRQLTPCHLTLTSAPPDVPTAPPIAHGPSRVGEFLTCSHAQMLSMPAGASGLGGAGRGTVWAKGSSQGDQWSSGLLLPCRQYPNLNRLS